ncbi:hypothetical protein [Actinokineospora pegani]|uniref:hypothetical protein n=1 Tax=Actinokineospora pegani TaxID=2654637 RepID=UPI0012EAB240|nr:hypothetical protein [Actinokineospora pegani]
MKVELVTVDGHLAGFAVIGGDVDDAGSWNVAEFSVARHHRRRGAGGDSAE